MAVQVQDVLDGGAPEDRTPPSRALVAAVAVAAVLAAALVAVVQRDTEPEASVEVAGSIVLDDISARRVELPSGDVRERDGLATGTVRLVLPDRELVGSARFEYDAALPALEDQAFALHAWGDVSLRFGANSCHGTFGWSNLQGPLDGGGALQVRCDDGATIAGRLAATQQPAQDTALDLRDGWYRAGPDDER